MPDCLFHLVCGSTGAGKTTYALRLCEDLGAIRFSIDEWMTSLFWMDSPTPIDPLWTKERIDRCNVQVWKMAFQLASRGTPSVLDLGFATRAHRLEAFAAIRDAGFSSRLHFVDVLPEERWRRVVERNSEKGENAQLRFEITRDLFDFVEAMWEPPAGDELRAFDAVIVKNEARVFDHRKPHSV